MQDGEGETNPVNGDELEWLQCGVSQNRAKIYTDEHERKPVMPLFLTSVHIFNYFR